MFLGHSVIPEAARRRRFRISAVTLVVLLVLLLLASCGPAAGGGLDVRQRPAVGTLALRGVTVVDVGGGRLVPDQTVVIAGNRVRQVGSASSVRPPAGARVVDAGGRYLIPGLWDMHAHVWEYAEVAYPLFVATGVTGIRDMGQSLGSDSTTAWRRQITAGSRIGPRVVGAGRMLESTADEAMIPVGRVIPVVRVESPAAARRVVDSIRAAGADFIKVHGAATPRDVYFALLAEVRRVGVPVAGHVPSTVTVREASDSGQRSVEHFNLVPMPCGRPDSATADSTAEQRCAALAARLRRNGTWFTPTLAVFYGWLGRAPEHRRFWPDSVEENSMLSIIGEEGVARLLDAGRATVGAAHRGGVPLLAGTDVSPGGTASVHHELALFAEAGLTPLEALRTATLNPATYLGALDSLGTVAPGKLADLVLLDADPLADIRNTTKIHAVVADGRYFDRAALDAILDTLERRARRKRAP